MAPIRDSFEREFSYLRLSVTDVCNFRCSYCLPNGYKKQNSPPLLTLWEIENLVSAFSELGFSKVRLTGGEPTTRKDILSIAECVSSISGIDKCCLSTNGYRLKELAIPLKLAGVSAINVSVDSLNPERFFQLTGHELKGVLEGVYASIEAGLKVKINVVLLNDMSKEDFLSFIEWTRNLPICLRFIELMETGENRLFFSKYHCSAAEIREKLESSGWNVQRRTKSDGPAIEFSHPDYLGTLGVIAPYSEEFCQNCNRLRVTSQGELRLCLFADSNYDLRPLLQSKLEKEELKASVLSIIQEKARSHYLHSGRTGSMTSLSIVGG